MAFPRVLKEVLSLPTAPFAEGYVIEYVQRFCDVLSGVDVTEDEHGNLLATYRCDPHDRTPVVFTAHMDHPGFVALEMSNPRTVRAAFRGWVESDYFVGTKVRFWSDGGWVRGKITRILKEAKVYRMIGRTSRPEEVRIEVSKPVAPGSPGMWDLPDPQLRDGKVYARGCDDMTGVASMLELLRRLSRKQVRGHCYCLFTRAEEVGFIGAIGAAKSGTIPSGLPIVAIENSKELPSARMGDGPILRVGDKSSIFTPDVTAYCERVGRALERRRPRFRMQRKLMDGGTCESTAFVAYGYPATGVCVALGNYHNMNEKRRRIASEYIALDDWRRMVDWFEALVLDETGYAAAPDRVREGLDQRFAAQRALLTTGQAAHA